MKHILPLLLCAACATTADLPPASPDTCGAASYGALIGQDATRLEKVLILGKVRVIRPLDAVTLDYLPDRINFMIGPDEKIASITCG